MKNQGGSRQGDSQRCVVQYMVNRTEADGDAFFRSCIFLPNKFTAVCWNLAINYSVFTRLYTIIKSLFKINR